METRLGAVGSNPIWNSDFFQVTINYLMLHAGQRFLQLAMTSVFVKTVNGAYIGMYCG